MRTILFVLFIAFSANLMAAANPGNPAHWPRIQMVRVEMNDATFFVDKAIRNLKQLKKINNKKFNTVIRNGKSFAHILKHAFNLRNKMAMAQIPKDFIYPPTVNDNDLPPCLGLNDDHYENPHAGQNNLLAFITARSRTDVNLCHDWFTWIKPSQVLIHEYTHLVLNHPIPGANPQQKQQAEDDTTFYTYEIMIAATGEFFIDGYYIQFGYDLEPRYKKYAK